MAVGWLKEPRSNRTRTQAARSVVWVGPSVLGKKRMGETKSLPMRTITFTNTAPARKHACFTTGAGGPLASSTMQQNGILSILLRKWMDGVWWLFVCVCVVCSLVVVRLNVGRPLCELCVCTLIRAAEYSYSTIPCIVVVCLKPFQSHLWMCVRVVDRHIPREIVSKVLLPYVIHSDSFVGSRRIFARYISQTRMHTHTFYTERLSRRILKCCSTAGFFCCKHSYVSGYKIEFMAERMHW